MRLTTLVALIAMTGTQGLAAEGAALFPLTVYLDGAESIPQLVISPAKGIASNMLAAVGVRVTWCHRLPRAGESRPGNTMVVRIENDPESRKQGGVIASAQVYEGSAITLLYSRMHWAEKTILGPKLLAHIMVHEITHNLQGVARHSDIGVMKAVWTPADYADMTQRPLPFEQYDLDLIKLGLNRRMAQIAANRSTGR